MWYQWSELWSWRRASSARTLGRWADILVSSLTFHPFWFLQLPNPTRSQGVMETKKCILERSDPQGVDWGRKKCTEQIWREQRCHFIINFPFCRLGITTISSSHKGLNKIMGAKHLTWRSAHASTCSILNHPLKVTEALLRRILTCERNFS